MGPVANNAGLETLSVSTKFMLLMFFARYAKERVQNENPNKRRLGDSLIEPVSGFITPKKVSIPVEKKSRYANKVLYLSDNLRIVSMVKKQNIKGTIIPSM